MKVLPLNWLTSARLLLLSLMGRPLLPSPSFWSSSSPSSSALISSFTAEPLPAAQGVVKVCSQLYGKSHVASCSILLLLFFRILRSKVIFLCSILVCRTQGTVTAYTLLKAWYDNRQHVRSPNMAIESHAFSCILLQCLSSCQQGVTVKSDRQQEWLTNEDEKRHKASLHLRPRD